MNWSRGSPKGELKSPYPDFAKFAEEGHRQFLRPGCNECHGGTGGGRHMPAIDLGRLVLGRQRRHAVQARDARVSASCKRTVTPPGPGRDWCNTDAADGARRPDRGRFVENHRLDSFSQSGFASRGPTAGMIYRARIYSRTADASTSIGFVVDRCSLLRPWKAPSSAHVSRSRRSSTRCKAKARRPAAPRCSAASPAAISGRAARPIARRRLPFLRHRFRRHGRRRRRQVRSRGALAEACRAAWPAIAARAFRRAAPAASRCCRSTRR